ncbi:hypothetical protein A0H81_09035 [Grifola frondosa]|uniref:Uncharacterized protein n=1 Tax=Grifola frondosa TaxID=5627 RepID=A0A1C7M256_GRIFR|nr:hypothetical protein A0H81_09035 [Grifola frondosa]
MALFNVSLDDSSPLFTYAPSNAWNDTPVDDSLAKSYSEASFHTTSLSGATAKLTFNGTGVWFFGARRPHYGSYVLVVDDDPTTYANASAPSPIFGQLLGGTSGLSMGEHTAVLMSGGTGPIDIDSLIYETQNQPDAASFINGSTSSSMTAVSMLAATPTNLAVDGTSLPAAVSGSSSAVGTSTAPSSTDTSQNNQSGDQQLRAPTGMLIGIVVVVLVALIMLALLLVFFCRRRRAKLQKAKKQMISPILPMQLPELESDFFDGSKGRSRWSQSSYDSVATLTGQEVPFKADMPKSLPAVALRDSRYSSATMNDDASDIASLYRYSVNPAISADRSSRAPELHVNV